MTHQRELLLTSNLRRDFESSTGKWKASFYCIDRRRWITVRQNLESFAAPITVTITNDDVNPNSEEHETRSHTLGEFTNTEPGWEAANAYAHEVIHVFGLTDEVDTTVDQVISQTRAVLAEMKGTSE